MSEDDLSSILEVSRAADMADWGEIDLTADVVRDVWRLPGMDIGSNCWIVETEDGTAVAFAWAHVVGELPVIGWGVVHPGHRGRGVGSFLVALRERRGAELLRGRPSADRRIQIDLIAPDEPAHRLVEVRGYRRVRHFWEMKILLEDDVATAPAPQGIRIRQFEKDVDDRATYAAIEEAFLDHWQHHPWTFEEWSERRFGSDTFDPNLWFLAVERDQIAGGLLGSISEGVGWVDVLGVRRPWRGRGIGECLLLRSFADFLGRGIRDVRLGVDAANPTGAIRLYERVGMQAHREYDVYEKPLDVPAGTRAGGG